MSGIGTFFGLRNKLRGISTVSYTHLDVYKRQGVNGLVSLCSISYGASGYTLRVSKSDSPPCCGGVVAELWPFCGENNACKNGTAIVLS